MTFAAMATEMQEGRTCLQGTSCGRWYWVNDRWRGDLTPVGGCWRRLCGVEDGDDGGRAA